MLTRCPSCQTVFRLTAEQLLARQGRVRCGNCLHPFNALDHLADPESQTVAPGAETAVSSAFPEASAGVGLLPLRTGQAPSSRERDVAFHSAVTQPFSMTNGFATGDAFPPRGNASLLPKPKPKPRQRPVLAPVVKKSSQRQLSDLDFSSSIDTQSRMPRIVRWSPSLDFPELDIHEEEEEVAPVEPVPPLPAPPPPPPPPPVPPPVFEPGDEVHSMLDDMDDPPPRKDRHGKQNREHAPVPAVEPGVEGTMRDGMDEVLPLPPVPARRNRKSVPAPVPAPGGEEKPVLDDSMDEPRPRVRHDEREKKRERGREKEREKGKEREKRTDRSKRGRHGESRLSRLSFFSRGESQKAPRRSSKHRENEHGPVVQAASEVIDEETLSEIFTKFGIETKINRIEAEFEAEAESKALEVSRKPSTETAPKSRKTAASYFDVYGKPMSARARAIWVSSVSMLSVALIVQATFLFRQGISRAFPDTRPFFVSACGSFGCEMPLPRDASLIRIPDDDFVPAQSGLPDQYSFYAKVRNEARFAQDWPHLELTLLDRAKREIARRVFTPAEWVPPEQRASGGFAPRGEVTTHIDLEVSGIAPEHFKVSHFYP